ncbi:hypothetical protein H4R18_005222 [Coemansia javaensis]|uniref:PCI domain-containing protein n=1 Tax=Coemansia javaensis TaxID=2761396 RepID=A0A9W8H998_9FUNG|nr:hypothetical protein H4R18_005222 [Coemansia javaensis]
MGGKDLFFVDGDQAAQAGELLKTLGVASDDVTAEAVVAASAGLSGAVDEGQLEAAYNQLFAVVVGAGGDAGLAAAAGRIAGDVAQRAAHGAAGLRVLSNLYNLVAAGPARAAVFEAVVALAARTRQLAALVPVVPRLAAMAGEWGAERGAAALLALRRAFDEAGGLGSEAFAVELAYLGAVADGGAQAAEVAQRAVARLASVDGLCDVDALAGLARVQELQRAGALGAAGPVLDQLVRGDYRQWAAFAAANAAALAELGIDAASAATKMRLLTLAAIAADRLGEEVPFDDVAHALDVPADDVELWVIDVVRAGLIQGKMNQVSRTLTPTRSTYRAFGEAQWRMLQTRLAQWKESLDALQPSLACSWDAAQRLCAHEAALVERRREVEEARAAAERALGRARQIVRLRRAAAEGARRLAALERRAAQRARAVEEAAAAADELGSAAAGEKRGQRDPAAARAHVARLARQLRQERIIGEDMRAMLARERARAARDAGAAFPVELGDGAWTVCGLRIERPSRVAGHQINETAAGLGAVARCVALVAACLAAPLRFPLLPRGSRSAAVATAAGAEQPLFMLRAADRPHMRAAVRMLAADIDQLLWAFGIAAAPPDRHDLLLPSLAQLLLAIESASFAA